MNAFEIIALIILCVFIGMTIEKQVSGIPEISTETQSQIRAVEIKEKEVLLEYCKEICMICQFYGATEGCAFENYKDCLDKCLDK